MFEGLLAPTHLIILLVIALLVLGPKRLPEAGRGMGEAIRGFKDSIAPRDAEETPAVVVEKAAVADEV
jgi:sec-independent protein translocase protein TatA